MNLTNLPEIGLSSLSLVQQPQEVAVAALVSALATIVLVAGFSKSRASRPESTRTHEYSDDGISSGFLLNGGNIKALTEPARKLISGFDSKVSRLNALTKHLEPDFPGIADDIEMLVLEGVGFRHHCIRDDGTATEFLGEPRGDTAYLSIRPASEDARALQQTRETLERTRDENTFLRRTIDDAPILIWDTAANGRVSWANAAYTDRFTPVTGPDGKHSPTSAFEHVLEEVPLTANDAGTRRRVSVTLPEDEVPHWFEIRRKSRPDGTTTEFALEADELVATESALRRFVETLTETFAHLPIGLAVFDKNRRLGLFNPALTDLVKIDAVWLAGRPSLRDFLERLRETRQMPDQKDFAAWRRKLSELEEGARDGTYEENWVLPSGKTFRVTGRPHPQGALAFLFEDISTSVMLERRYRSELELSQATFDRLNEAVAVFGASGTLAFVNSAFERLWSLDEMNRIDGPGISEFIGLWKARCAPSEIWGKLAEFATSADHRESWSEEIETLDGRCLQVHVAPLPDASALVLFRDLTAECGDRATSDAEKVAAVRAEILNDLTLERALIPVESAIQQVISAHSPSQSNEEHCNLNKALQNLKDGLSGSGKISVLSDDNTKLETGPLPALKSAMAGRGLRLDVPDEASDWPLRTRGTAMALGLAVAEHTPTGSTVSLSLSLGDDNQVITASAKSPASAQDTDGPALALVTRIAQSVGGSTEIVSDDGVLSIRAILPDHLNTDLPATAS